MKTVYRLYGKTTAAQVEKATGAIIEKRKGKNNRLLRYDVSSVHS